MTQSAEDVSRSAGGAWGGSRSAGARVPRQVTLDATNNDHYLAVLGGVGYWLPIAIGAVALPGLGMVVLGVAKRRSSAENMFLLRSSKA